MWQKIRAIFSGADHGQDLAEYTLIVAFLCIILLAVVVRLSGGINTIWTTGNTVLTTANTSASGSGGSHGGGGDSGGGR